MNHKFKTSLQITYNKQVAFARGYQLVICLFPQNGKKT